ncbi:MAG: sulfatase, partial [Candidatus Aminicenantes bacterium]|nr:sulfatase [Candidatus Aminicenantes bacterium]
MAKKKRKKARQKKSSVRQPARNDVQSQHLSPPADDLAGISEKQGRSKPKKRALLYVGLLVIASAAVLIYLFYPKSTHRVTKSGDLNVMLITLDTTRADRIGCYGYGMAETPNLDHLASEGVRFAHAYCQVPLTLPSHCSLMTGTYPLFHRVHNNGFYYLNPEERTLAEALKDGGYQTAAFVSSFTVDSRFGLNQGFDFYEDDFLEIGATKNFTSERRADKVYGAFVKWFDVHYRKKFFCWVHFYDPHIPYNPPSPFKEKYAERPYDGEIAYMDVYVGKVLEKLKEKGVLDSTLVVLAGDHGEALGEKNEVDHGLYIYDVTMRVPFILYAPENIPQGLALDAKVRLIDILPTVCDLVGASLPEDVQGTTLLPYMTGRKKQDLSSYLETYMPREYYGWSELLGIIEGDWKYIKAPKPELY